MTGGAVTLAAKGVETRRRPGATFSIAWTPSEDIDVREWVRAGKRLGAMTRCSQWWLGDWVRYGTGRWGEKYKEAARISGYDIKTLRNIAYVAEQIEVSRRRDDLTWSHHAEVCGLEPEEQDKWLEVAAAQRMSVADLRIELRGARREEDPAGQPKSESKMVKCPNCDHRFEVPAKGTAADE
jgi:hypothetical protein